MIEARAKSAEAERPRSRSPERSRRAAAEIPSILSEGSMRVNRLALALTAYVVLGALAWTTLTDEKLRLVTLLILALFAVKTVLRRRDVMHPDGEDR